MPEIVFLHGFYLALRSRSGSRSKVKGQGQMSGVQRSTFGAPLCRVQQIALDVHLSY